jgi:LEA14-like dessication related protein
MRVLPSAITWSHASKPCVARRYVTTSGRTVKQSSLHHTLQYRNFAARLNRLISIGVFAGLVTVAGCSNIASRAVAMPQWHLADIDALQGTLVEQQYALHFELENTNAFGVTLRSLKWQMLVDGQLIATGMTDAPVQLPAHGTGELVVRVTLRSADVLVLAVNLKQRVDHDLPYTITGSAILDPGGIAVKLAREGSVRWPAK